MSVDKINNFANCGLYWVSNSLISAGMGFVNRHQQEQNVMQNLDFQLVLEEVRNQAQDEIQAEQIAFKRKIMKIARQYRQEEAVKLSEQQLKSIELQSFIENYWPLAPQMPNIILNEIKQSCDSNEILPLNIVLLREPLVYPQKVRYLMKNIKDKNIDIYENIEYQLEQQFKTFGDIKLRRDCCDVSFISGNANMMNIHFLMGALPTIVISPQYDDNGNLIFSAATWDAQASRPLVRRLFSIKHEPLFAWEEENTLTQSIETIKTAISIIVGTTRDSYMLINHGKTPMLDKILTEEQKRILMSEESLKLFVSTEYNNIIKALDANSANKLLEAYSEYDIEYMRDKAYEMCLMFKN